MLEAVPKFRRVEFDALSVVRYGIVDGQERGMFGARVWALIEEEFELRQVPLFDQGIEEQIEGVVDIEADDQFGSVIPAEEEDAWVGITLLEGQG